MDDIDPKWDITFKTPRHHGQSRLSLMPPGIVSVLPPSPTVGGLDEEEEGEEGLSLYPQ